MPLVAFVPREWNKVLHIFVSSPPVAEQSREDDPNSSTPLSETSLSLFKIAAAGDRAVNLSPLEFKSQLQGI